MSSLILHGQGLPFRASTDRPSEEEPRQLEVVARNQCVSCRRTTATLLESARCLMTSSLAMVRPSTLSWSTDRPWFSLPGSWPWLVPWSASSMILRRHSFHELVLHRFSLLAGEATWRLSSSLGHHQAGSSIAMPTTRWHKRCYSLSLMTCPEMPGWQHPGDRRGRRLGPPASNDTSGTQEAVWKEKTCHATCGPRWTVYVLGSAAPSHLWRHLGQCGMRVWRTWTDCRAHNHRLPPIQPTLRSWPIWLGTRDEGVAARHRVGHLMIHERRRIGGVRFCNKGGFSFRVIHYVEQTIKTRRAAM